MFELLGLCLELIYRLLSLVMLAGIGLRSLLCFAPTGKLTGAKSITTSMIIPFLVGSLSKVVELLALFALGY